MFAIHAIIASHNRRPVTLQAISSLLSAAQDRPFKLTVTLFDDGSSDGTTEAVAELLSTVRIISGSGSAFWAAGMAAAEAAVLADPEVKDQDYVLWLNDDVVMDTESLDRLLSVSSHQPDVIVVGAVRDPEKQTITYSGLRRAGLHPLRYARVMPNETMPLSVETFNGNVVLTPVRLARALNGIDGSFAHAFADIDYGIRARRLGASIFLAPGSVGTCRLNPERPRQSIGDEWSQFTGVKGGGHFKSLSRILRRIRPVTWPLYILITYSLWWVRQLTSRLPRS